MISVLLKNTDDHEYHDKECPTSATDISNSGCYD